MMRSCGGLLGTPKDHGKKEIRETKESWERNGIMGEAGYDGNDVTYCGLLGTTRDYEKKGIGETTRNHGNNRGIM